MHITPEARLELREAKGISRRRHALVNIFERSGQYSRIPLTNVKLPISLASFPALPSIFHILRGFTVACLATSFAAAQIPAVLSGKISEVTVYQGTALVSRVVEIPPAQAAPMEVVVSGLPSATDPNSVYADQAQGVVIRSIAFRTKTPDKAAQAQSEVARLEQSMKDLRRASAIAQNEIALRRIRQQFLKRLGSDFVAPAAQQEMTHGVLQADELQKLTKLHFEEYEKASQEIMKLDLEIEENTAQLQLLEDRRKTLAAGPPVAYEAVVYLQKTAAGPASLKLNYLVNDCGWDPSYNFRGDTAKGEVAMEFNAIVQQVSGEDWSDVKLALSTASPSVGAYNPQLSPLFVRVQPGAAKEESRTAAQTKYSQALASRQEALVRQFRGNSIDEMLRANFAANESAASVQLMELTERIGNLRALEGGKAEPGSVVYAIERPVSLQSRRDAQLVPVLSGRMKSKFYQVAAPVLTSSVFREASLNNNTGRDLLGGKVNVFLDGEFTGRTDIPTIASGQGFAISFGVDSQLRARRSLVDRSEIVQGGNRQFSFTYEIVVDNFKQAPARLILRDRTPNSGDIDTLRVALGEISHPLSQDADYQRFDKPKGLLMWDLEIKPGAGPSATTLRYAYSAEYDKNLTLLDIGGPEKERVREEFMQKARATKGF
ncbi:MAG: hypothetical protein QOE70_485 [Chthoniobacter sp.]|jgi:uncharacterized protein (TIGR02231 family)|nr:hypothetical protein [Chthoniobacter sp.]